MKRFWHKVNKPFWILFFLAAFLRFYQLESRTNFTADQGRDFLLIKHLVDERRLTLLGPSASVGDFFFGPLYYYLLGPALILGKFAPLSGAILVIVFDLVSFGLFFLLVKKVLSSDGALVALSLYATSPLLVNVVRVPLNPFVIPAFAVLFLLLTHGKTLTGKRWAVGLGLVTGFLVELHFVTAPFALVGMIFALSQKQKLENSGAYLVGIVLGLLPMIAFELRHQFFNTLQLKDFLLTSGEPGFKTFFILPRELADILARLVGGEFASLGWVFLIALGGISFKVISQGSFWQRAVSLLALVTLFAKLFGANLNDHYLMAVFPIIFLLVARSIQTLPKRMMAVLAFILVVMNLRATLKPVNQGYLMAQGWNLLGTRRAAAIIAQDAPEVFTVAATLDGDTRALPYRYLLETHYNKIPLGVEQYPEAQVLYVVTREEAAVVVENPVWEIASLGPSRVAKTWLIQEGIYLHRLEKTES